ncbi:SDR family oxidoreductase [Streptosporangium sp. CA-135522]|uniref:SDR family oxidoreductase n=1 Tax=Streptosporangium sp. CA-135522 TaxID=3240072 RepID=UPI003D89DFD9
MGSFMVVGGAGRTGRRVVEALTGAGHQVTLASRRPGRSRDGLNAVILDLARGVDPELLAGMSGVVVSVEPPSDSAGADAVLNRGVASLAEVASRTGAQVVLVSQIYVTRARQHPGTAGIIEARARGEQALRISGAPYTIIRPSWLTDRPAGGVRLEQGDTGDGRISRDAVAAAAVAALSGPTALGKTFELYDDPSAPDTDWPAAFAGLAADAAVIRGAEKASDM